MSDETFSPDLKFEPEPVSPYDPQDGSGKRALILLGLTFGGLLLLATLVFRIYGDGTKTRDDIPSIRASAEPFKEEVTDDTVAPDTREIYAALDGTDAELVVPAPEPERPVRLLDPLPETMTVEIEPVRPVPTEPALSGSVPVEPIVPEPMIADSAPSREVDIPAPEPARPAPVQPEPATSAGPSGTVSGDSSGWVVQVASLRSRAEADATYGDISRRFSDLLPATAFADVQRADLAEKGIYFRVRLAGLADKGAASRLCESFKASGQACFVTRR